MQSVIERLLNSDNPSIRFKVLVCLMGRDPNSLEMRMEREKIRRSSLVRSLLSERKEDGRIPYHPYRKWYGAHWVLASLADIGYPPGDESLIPLREQVYRWLFSKEHERKIKAIEGRTRRCASQEGNALFYLLALGLSDPRTDELLRRLLSWQWPDGGWNCDKNPKATNSSFNESLIPLRALALYQKVSGERKVSLATERAAELFLKRRLFKRVTDGSIIREDFVRLHYPPYWHYDFLFGLKVMAEAGFIRDRRCSEALDLLESKRLPQGGFPAEKKYYEVTQRIKSGRSLIDWGGTSRKKMNEFVTVDSLYVLKESGRLR